MRSTKSGPGRCSASRGIVWHWCWSNKFASAPNNSAVCDIEPPQLITIRAIARECEYGLPHSHAHPMVRCGSTALLNIDEDVIQVSNQFLLVVSHVPGELLFVREGF